MSNQPKRGEIWLIDWSPARGSEQSGFSPALIIQTDSANNNPKYPNTIVLVISTKGKPVPFHVPLQPDLTNGLSETSFVKCEQIMTISKERLNRKLGKIEDDTFLLINKAVTKVLEIMQ